MPVRKRDLPAHRLARKIERSLADLLLAARKMEVQRPPRGAGSSQHIVQGGAVEALPAKQQGRCGQGFLFGISSFCHARQYQLPIGMSSYMICRMTYIVRFEPDGGRSP